MKIVGQNIYLHVSVLNSPGDDRDGRLKAIRDLVDLAIRLPTTRPIYNVLKVDLIHRVVSFLHYPKFDRTAHPELKQSVRCNVAAWEVSITRYGPHDPPVLHRKELMVNADYPLYQRFKEITEAEEKAGLLEECGKVGLKRAWQQRLRQMGYSIICHHLRRTPGFTMNPLHCKHKDVRWGVSRHEPHMDKSIEICNTCGASRAHTEQDASPWSMVDLNDVLVPGSDKKG